MNAIIILLLLVQSIAFSAEIPADFAYGIPIESDARDALYEIEIPAAVYRGVTRADLGDIRVFNGQGEVVPHALRPLTRTVAAVSLPIFPLYGEADEKLEDLSVRINKRGDGTIVDIQNRAGGGKARQLRGYLLDASALKPAIEALVLDWQTASESFVGQVRVEGSDDLAAWIILADRAALARLNFAGHQVQRNRVDLRFAKFKYLRVSWPKSQAPLESLSASAEPAGHVIDSPRVWQTIAGSESAGKKGEYSYDLSGHFPFDRLRIELPQVNNLAQVQILARAATSDEWRHVTSATAYRLRDRDTEVTNQEIAVMSGGERYWLLRADPKGGGVGSGVPGIQIGWVPQRLVFVARGAGPFQLAFGNAGAKPMAYPIESLIPGYKTDAEFKVKPATLGAQVTLSGAARLRTAWDYKKLALWGSLIFGVMLLGWMAWRLSRQIAKPQAEPKPTEK
jgi:Protein of unknown function (DUF3999)